MDTIIGIAVLVLTPIIWLFYHKVFRVTYFGSAGQTIFKEIVGSFFASCVIVAIVKVVGGALFSGLGVVLKFLLKVILVVVCIALVVFLIKKIISVKNVNQENHAMNNAGICPTDNDVSTQSDDVNNIK